MQKKEDTTISKSSILLEKVKKVCKIVTVEGHFTELYSHQDYKYYNFYPFRKKAILKVDATVHAGYDLQNVEFEMREDIKTIFIKNLPQPTIQSVDTKISYYNISEGTFNSFSTEELTELNHNAREFIMKKSNTSELMTRAE